MPTHSKDVSLITYLDNILISNLRNVLVYKDF